MTGHLILDVTDACAVALNRCAGSPLKSATEQPVTILSTQTKNATGHWIQGRIDCGAVAGPPGLDAAAVHDEFVKLVPSVDIKSAPPSTAVLVNVETLMWLDTPADVDLGTTRLLGHNVNLIATVATVRWDFGDRHSDTTNGPGRPFLDADHCGTVSCPDWFGHIYTNTGQVALSATVTWTGRYNIDGGPYLAIAGTVTSQPITTALHVYESRAVLVPNATDLPGH